MAEQTETSNFRYRIRRETQGAIAWFRENWRDSRLFRWGVAAGGGHPVDMVGAVACLGAQSAFGRKLARLPASLADGGAGN